MYLPHFMTRHNTYTQVLLEAGANIEACDTLNKYLFTTHIFAAFNDTLLHMHSGTTRGRSRHRSARHVKQLAFYHTSLFTTHTFAAFYDTLLHISTGTTRGRSKHRGAWHVAQNASDHTYIWSIEWHVTLLHIHLLLSMARYYPYTQVLLEVGADIKACDTWNKSLFTTHAFAAFNDTSRSSHIFAAFNYTLLRIHIGTTRGRSRHWGAWYVEQIAFYHTHNCCI